MYKKVIITNANTARKLLSDNDKNTIIQLEKISPWRSSFLYMQVYVAIAIAIFIAVTLSNSLITLLAIIFIAGRQHSLYILNHDASHNTLFTTKKINKLVATFFSNLVMFHHPEAWSYIQWRRVHLKHHQYLFTEDDPNYVGRKAAGDTEKNYTFLQLLMVCLLAGPQAIKLFFFGKQDYVNPKIFKFSRGSINHLASLFLPFRNDQEMEKERCMKLLFFSVTLSFIVYFDAGKLFLIFWIVPMYSFYPMILKFHDLTEHNWNTCSNDLNANTQSTKRNVIFKLLFSILPRGFHREHHMFPKVSVVNLTKLNYLLYGNAKRSNK